jgi:hypothetical protein
MKNGRGAWLREVVPGASGAALPLLHVGTRCFQTAQQPVATRGRAEPEHVLLCRLCKLLLQYIRARDSDTSWAWMSRWSDDDGNQF